MPLLLAPKVVVETPDVKIEEFAGNASDGQPGISVARSTAQGGWAEEWQCPEFDEWVVVNKGKVVIETANHDPVEVTAGNGVMLCKGERVRWTFPEGGAEYIAICLPGFTPDNVHREEGPDAKPPVHDSHQFVYHLVQEPIWVEAKEKGEAYYPPTYKTDGFTHLTADPKYLLEVGNHFYKSTTAKWRCLKLSRQSVLDKGLQLKWEWPSPVGDIAPLSSEQSGGERFPHLYSGIPTNDIVLSEHDVTRGPDGEFTAIEGVC